MLCATVAGVDNAVFKTVDIDVSMIATVVHDVVKECIASNMIILFPREKASAKPIHLSRSLTFVF